MGLLDVPGYSRTQADRRFTASAPRRLAVADNCFGFSYYTPMTTAQTMRTPHTMGISSGGLSIVLVNFWNHLLDGSGSYNDADGTGTYTARASIEIVGGPRIYPVTFRGQLTATVDPGGIVESDPVGVQLAAGTVFYTRVAVLTGTYYPNRQIKLNAGSGGIVAGDLTPTGSASINDSTGWGLAPAAIIGTTA